MSITFVCVFFIFLHIKMSRTSTDIGDVSTYLIIVLYCFIFIILYTQAEEKGCQVAKIPLEFNGWSPKKKTKRQRKYDLLTVLAKVRTHVFEFFMYIKLYIFDELYTLHLHNNIDSVFCHVFLQVDKHTVVDWPSWEFMFLKNFMYINRDVLWLMMYINTNLLTMM